MTPEQENKWREEFEDIEREHYSLDQWRHLYLKTNGDYTYECKKRWDRYLTARKAAQVEHEKESKRWEDIIFIMDDQDLTPELLKIKIDSLEYGNEYLKIQLKDRDQEIERLKLDVKHGCSICATQPEVTITSLEEQLKERDELIKKSIPYIEYAIKYSTPLSQNKAEELVKNIKTLLGE